MPSATRTQQKLVAVIGVTTRNHGPLMEPHPVGIPAFRAVDIDWDEQPLGELPDVELAKRLDVSVNAVRVARRKRNVDAYVESPL